MGKFEDSMRELYNEYSDKLRDIEKDLIDSKRVNNPALNSCDCSRYERMKGKVEAMEIVLSRAIDAKV